MFIFHTYSYIFSHSFSFLLPIRYQLTSSPAVSNDHYLSKHHFSHALRRIAAQDSSLGQILYPRSLSVNKLLYRHISRVAEGHQD